MLDAFKGFVADLARPFAIWSLASGCTAGLLIATVTSDKLGLALTALGLMYGAKAAENYGAAKQNATIQVAQAQAAGPMPPPSPAAVNVEQAGTVTTP